MQTDVLSQVDVFRDLDDQALSSLAQKFVEVHVPPEFLVFREGRPVDAFYVVASGRVVVYRDVVGKPVQLLARVGPTEFFGELALFTQADNTISARALEASCILKIDKQALLDFLDSQPAITLKLQMAAARGHTINAAAALELGQRDEVRIRIDHNVVLMLADGSLQPAVLDNLSPGGLSLRGAPEIWSEGDQVDFNVQFGDDVLHCEGRIAWIQGDLLGFAFTDTSQEHDSMIQHSLRRLLTQPRRTSAHGR